MCRLMRRAAVQERRQFHYLCVFPPRGRFAPVEQMREFAMEVRVKSNTYPSTHHNNPLRNPSDHPACPTLPPSTYLTVEHPRHLLVAGQVRAINAGLAHDPGVHRALLDELRIVMCVVFAAVKFTCSAGRARAAAGCWSGCPVAQLVGVSRL